MNWFNLTPAQRTAAQELQYTREAWDNCTRTEVTDLEYWHQLTDEQQKAAQVLGFQRETWHKWQQLRLDGESDEDEDDDDDDDDDDEDEDEEAGEYQHEPGVFGDDGD